MATFTALSPRVASRAPLRNFPLEPFACGLASENADEHAQRLVAAIARRAPSVFRVESVDCASLETGS